MEAIRLSATDNLLQGLSRLWTCLQTVVWKLPSRKNFQILHFNSWSISITRWL